MQSNYEKISVRKGHRVGANFGLFGFAVDMEILHLPPVLWNKNDQQITYAPA